MDIFEILDKENKICKKYDCQECPLRKTYDYGCLKLTSETNSINEINIKKLIKILNKEEF